MHANDLPISPAEAVTAGMPPAAAADAPTPSTPPAALPRPRKRRRRRWLFVLGCLLVLAALPVGYYFYQTWMADREMAAVIARIEATDPRWRLEDILADRPTVADADNPALVVDKVVVLLRANGNFDLGEKGWHLFDNLTAAHQLHESQIGVLRPELAKHEEALKLARTLKDFPGEGRFTIKLGPDWLSTNLEPMQRCRNVMSLLQNDAMLRAEDDDPVGAMESCRALLVTARSIGSEPFLIAMLIRCAGQGITISALERTLAQGEPPAGELEKMQELLTREIEAPVLTEAMRGERAGIDKLVAQLDNGKVKASALMMGLTGGKNSSWEAWFLDHIPIVLTKGRGDQLEMMTRAVEAAKLPPERQKEAFADVDKSARESSSIVVRLLMPAVLKVSEANRRGQANLRCAMVGVAAERYRLRHNQWPAALDDLVTDGLLKAIPIDPYDGQPLRYRRRPEGAVVYSVGNDGVDNGGNIRRDRPLDPGVDLGFELWDLQARRQTALPPKLENDDGAP